MAKKIEWANTAKAEKDGNDSGTPAWTGPKIALIYRVEYYRCHQYIFLKGSVSYLLMGPGIPGRVPG